MAKVAVSENSLTILNYLKEHEGDKMTAQDIADALNLEVKSVNGVVTAGLQRKGYAERIPAEVELEDGTHKVIKFIQITEAGKAYDHAAAQAEDVAAQLKAE